MLSLLFAGVITVTPLLPGTFDRYGIERPPARYAYFPNQPVLRLSIPLHRLTRVCGPLDPTTTYYGCTESTSLDIVQLLMNPALTKIEVEKIRERFISQHNLCIIFVPTLGKQVSFGFQWSIWTHELAHCNGIVHSSTGHGWFLPNGTPVD